MTPVEALALVRSEVAAATPMGKALLVLLEDAEIQNYRKSTQTIDALMTAKICGRGEGINAFLQRIAPVQEDAPQMGRPRNAPAAGA